MSGPVVYRPKCGMGSRSPVKVWTGGAKTRNPMKVSQFVCSSCRTNYAAWSDPKTGKLKVMARRGSKTGSAV